MTLMASFNGTEQLEVKERDLISCVVVEVCRLFEGTYYLCLQSGNVSRTSKHASGKEKRQ
jgi:hypothetical protein